MKQKKKILIAGGDMRQLYCALRLCGEYDTAVIGFDDDFFPNGAELNRADLSEKYAYDYAVLPVLPIDADGFLSTPCSEKKISVEAISELIKLNGEVFAGKPDENLSKIMQDKMLHDYISREELSLLNAIPTAEGAVQIAMEELPVTLSGLKILIVGCGRIGSALINILKGFGADITVAVRNARGAAKVRIAGVKYCCTNEISPEYSLVFNTVPSMIFSRKLLEQFDKSTLFIDLASKPGGMDFDAAAELGIKAIWALGLPGKTAPITSGEIIADTINGILSERGDTDA